MDNHPEYGSLAFAAQVLEGKGTPTNKGLFASHNQPCNILADSFCFKTKPEPSDLNCLFMTE